jgi:succinate dehydrogenase flavin-adding protein (antitoxin of CptAB toxin-antitoxin module)
MVRKVINHSPQLSSEQLDRLAKLEEMPDSQINYSDIPPTPNWQEAIQGPVVLPSNLLDGDIVAWLAIQDSDTKRHVSEVIRHIMALQQANLS